MGEIGEIKNAVEIIENSGNSNLCFSLCFSLSNRKILDDEK